MNVPTLRRLSHDLRGSLANLRMGLQACRESPEMLGMLGEALLQEVDRLDGRLIQLSWMARCSAPNRDQMQVHLVVEGWAKEKGLEQLKLEPVRASIDPDLLKAALDQLYDNAVKHGGGYGGTFLRMTGRRLQLEIHDAGKGWPGNIYDWLKDPQLWNGQIALGLPMAQKVAQAHEGELVLEPGSAGLSIPL
ncbi:MAG: HAMP domain-containing histidine kinase [Candidatus Eremiobacteraeota bacterium]|nr:HAMP domain-containing histidine kinase [Candidatus Eremiobacteraeota bacterium]MCW5868087.1 HAMP domain-containing histidine kinase [Candidatus Eremiobacteraeota bacterium]